MPVLVLLLLLVFPLIAHAQTTPQPAPPPAASPPSAGPGEGLLRREQLEALVAPIALYPDALLAQVLMASTYPLEVVQADRWITENKDLKGDALSAALAKQSWDDSVKSLVPTPSVLAMMNKKLDWTQRLGDAVLAQEGDVMDAVQRLRARAQATDKLKTTKEQNVTVRKEGGTQIIAIDSADPDTVYVPYYDPAVVYGAWPYPDYPPDYYYPDDYWLPGGIIATGIAFGTAYAIWRWASGGWWGHIDWRNRNLDFKRGDRVEHWRHNPQHRRGVAYSNPKVRQQFAGATGRPGDRARGAKGPGDRGKQAGGPKGGAKQAGKGGGAKQAARGKRTAQKGAGQGKRTAQGKGTQARRAAQTNRANQARRTTQIARRGTFSSARAMSPASSVRASDRVAAGADPTAGASAAAGAVSAAASEAAGGSAAVVDAADVAPTSASSTPLRFWAASTTD